MSLPANRVLRTRIAIVEPGLFRALLVFADGSEAVGYGASIEHALANTYPVAGWLGGEPVTWGDCMYGRIT